MFVALKKPAVLKICLLPVLTQITDYMLSAILIVYAIELKADIVQITAITAISGTMYILLQIPFGILSDRVGRVPVITGGLLVFSAGAVVAALGGHVLWPSLGQGGLALVGAALAALGIIGDLFESLLKRSAGVKDSSALIPGHGGVLDRIDALLFAAPVYYVVLKCL